MIGGMLNYGLWTIDFSCLKCFSVFVLIVLVGTAESGADFCLVVVVVLQDVLEGFVLGDALAVAVAG